VTIPHILKFELDATEDELEGLADRERGMPSGSFWLPHHLLNARLRSVREIDPAAFCSAVFWRDWEDWYARRAAVATLDELGAGG
jgi:hypothetical protein